jgi:serine/threonine-protein kinase
VAEEKPRSRGKKIKFGPFTVLRKLGEGGMGIVYLAEAESAFGSERIALKVLPPKAASDLESRMRFEREARILISVDHPNIIHGREFGSVKKALYMTMEYVEGPSLADLLEAEKALGEMATLDVGIQMARALQGLQRNGYIHRDVNPANILIDKEGVAKLMDFGLAIEDGGRAQPITEIGLVVGTPHVIAPERIAQKRDLDIRSDIYSLGITLYATATGQAPFGEDTTVILERHVGQMPVEPSTLAPLSGTTEQIILKMLSKERDKRFPSATELLEALSESMVQFCKSPKAAQGRTLKQIVTAYLEK